MEPVSFFFVKKGSDLRIHVSVIAVESVAGLRGQVVGIDEVTIERDKGQGPETKEATRVFDS